MRKALLFAALWFAAVTSAVASTRVIPVAGHVPGANNTAWTTDVSLRNNSGSSLTVDLIFHAGDGVARTRSVVLGPHESTLLEDAVAPARFPGNNPASWLGQLEIRSSGDVTASAHIFTRAASGGTYGSTYDGFDPAVLSTSGSIAGLVNSGRFRSNVAFSNPTGSAISVTYNLRKADGSVAATRQFELPAHVTRQFAIAQDVPQSADEARLSLAWSASGRAYAVGSIIDNRSGDPTSAPSISRDATSLFYPVVGRTAGSNQTFWSTAASVSGTTAVAGTVTFAYTDAATRQTYTRTAVLPPLGGVTTEDVNELVGAPAGTGSLRITATAPLAAVVRVFNTLADGSTFGSSVLPQDSVVRSTRVNIDGVRRDDDYRLNVAVANDDSAPSRGRVRLFDDRGVEVDSQPFHVERDKPVQISLRQGADVRAGQVRVEADNGIAVTAVASNVDNRTGDTIQREAEQQNERQNELEIAMSTRTAVIGTPVVFSLKHAGSDIAAVNWSFGDGSSATGATVGHAYKSAGEFDVTVAVTLTSGAIVRDREDLRITGSGTPATTPAGAIDFSWSPAAPAPGEQVVFTATGATNGGVFKWKFPGDIRPIGNTVTFSFPTAGSFEVEVEIEHGATTAEVTRVVTVGGTPSGTTPGQGPIDFTFSPANPQPGQAVTFTASGATGGGTYKWKFPGDVRKFGPTATFTFTGNGSFEVEVEVEHGTVVAEITKIVNVGTIGNPNSGGSGPLSFTFSPANPQPGQEVTFTAAGNTGGGAYKWKFPGDVRKFGNVVTFTFPSAGSFEVELEIEHGTILAEITRIVTVGGGNTNPGNPDQGTGALNFTFSPSNPQPGQAVTFTASGATGGGVYKWKFPGDVRMFGSVVTFTFPTAGTFAVEVEIEHGSIVAEVTKFVTVGGGSGGNPEPGTGTLDFTFSPSSPRAGQTVTFTASGNTGGGFYKWKFPDDSRPTGAVVTYTFPAAGSYEVEVEIEDGTSEVEVQKIIRVSP